MNLPHPACRSSIIPAEPGEDILHAPPRRLHVDGSAHVLGERTRTHEHLRQRWGERSRGSEDAPRRRARRGKTTTTCSSGCASRHAHASASAAIDTPRAPWPRAPAPEDTSGRCSCSPWYSGAFHAEAGRRRLRRSGLAAGDNRRRGRGRASRRAGKTDSAAASSQAREPAPTVRPLGDKLEQAPRLASDSRRRRRRPCGYDEVTEHLQRPACGVSGAKECAV